MTTLDKSDIQSVVLTGFPDHPHASFVFLRVVDPIQARAWLARWLPTVTTTKERKPGPRVLNIALSGTGLRALGLDQDALATFPRELQEGMAGTEHRSRVLGDTGTSAPETWVFGGTNAPGGPSRTSVDVMLLCYAHSDAELQALLSELRRDYLERGAMREVYVRDTQMLPTHTEHFGFADGISQPRVAGSGARSRPGAPLLPAGEFILGYPNDYGKMPPSPSVRAPLDAHDVLPALAVEANGDSVTTSTPRRDFGRNGSFLVVRELAQDVQGFWQAMYERSGPTEATRNQPEAVRLAAKCVGRWPSGAPLALAPDADRPHLRDANAFGYAQDPHGLSCPIGAHVRRSNPRDSLEPTPEASIRDVNRRRILRRGRSFGPRLEPFQPESPPRERGLLFIAVNANIRRQFEFIQQTWINNPKFDGLHEDKDPLVSDQDPETFGKFTIPGHPTRRQLTGLTRFVTVRGGEYFFLPSIRALRMLSTLDA